MNYELSEEKWDSIKTYLNKVWKNPDKYPDKYPDKGLFLSLSDSEVTQIFTKKRTVIKRNSYSSGLLDEKSKKGYIEKYNSILLYCFVISLKRRKPEFQMRLWYISNGCRL